MFPCFGFFLDELMRIKWEMWGWGEFFWFFVWDNSERWFDGSLRESAVHQLDSAALHLAGRLSPYAQKSIRCKK